MENEFIPYEEDLALKVLGFNEECFSHYYRDGDISRKFHLAPITNDCILVECAAPLYQQAFRWFREEHKLHGELERDFDGWCYKIIEFSQGNKFIKGGSAELPYEVSRLDCLKKLIEIVNENKDE